jgi:hypothetical protein
MANRIEITENVENATGINIAAGATVVVKLRGGAVTSVYDREDGGAVITQPLLVVDGKIGADNPAGAWVPAGTKYDLEVTFGGNTLVFPWTSPTYIPLVTTLPAGVGTAAPEDGEFAEELYDAANGAAWLRRYRSAASAWDMIGGPPPAGGSLPGTPRARQEFYLTGGTPAVQHQRYNGASWDYVGTPPTVPVTGSPLSILEVGQSGQNRAGRILSLADFTTLCALPSTPVLLANLTTLTSNLGSGGALVNKNTTLNGTGIDGAATAAQFRGASGTPANDPVLYIDDTGAADPFRLKTYTAGCWVRTAKRGLTQRAMSKIPSTGASLDSWIELGVLTTNVAFCSVPLSASPAAATGSTDICDDRWHHIAFSYDGATVRLYVDGVLEDTVMGVSNFALTTNAAPFNIGGYGGNAGTAVTTPWYGRIDEAFVTPDVLSDDQIRLIYAAKIPHGYSTTPTRVHLNVRRKRRGAALVSGDFPSQPVRLHNFVAGAVTDAGTGGVSLTPQGVAAVTVSGPDGTKDDAYNFFGASTSFSATDTGLPGGTSTRSYGCWFKTTTLGTGQLVAWGGLINSAETRIGTSSGVLTANNGADSISGPFIADGQWHFAVVTENNTAGPDGLKRKLYLDGRLVAASTVLNSVTLTGANRFRIGAAQDSSNFFTGQISRVFVHSSELTREQIEVLYQKSGQTLSTSPSEPGQQIEAFDATNIYAILDQLDSNYTVDMAVAA